MTAAWRLVGVAARARRRALVALALAALGVASWRVMPLAHAANDPATLARGRELTAAFERGDLASVYARGSKAWQDGVGGEQGLTELRERVLREDGPETGLIQEEARVDGPYRIYRRIARRNVGETPTLMEWTLDADGRIVALDIRPQPIAIPSGKVGY